MLEDNPRCWKAFSINGIPVITGTDNPAPMAASFNRPLKCHPMSVRGSPFRQRKKTIRLVRAISRKISENAVTGKLMPSLPKAKNEIIIDGTMRKRKTETSKRSLRHRSLLVFGLSNIVLCTMERNRVLALAPPPGMSASIRSFPELTPRGWGGWLAI